MNAPGVTVGYLLAGAAAAALWIGIGVLLMPVMAVLALLHWIAGSASDAVVTSHHRWLARHHALSVVALLCVLAVPLLALPTLRSTAMTVFNTMAYAPHPAETLAAAWPELGVGTLMFAAFIAVAGWVLVTLWLSIRVILGWLRWADRRPA